MSMLLHIVGTVILIVFSLTVHEIGHLLGGLFSGFRFHLFIAGFLKISRLENGKIKISLNKDLSLFGGVAASLPKEIRADNNKKFAMVIISGPLASLFYSILAFSLIKYIPEYFEYYLLIAGASSVGIFFGTIIPNKSGLFFSDRKRFQRLLSKRKESQVESSLINLISLQIIDKNLCRADYNDIEIIKTDPDRMVHFFALYYDVMYHYDNKIKNLDSCWQEFDKFYLINKTTLLTTMHKELKDYITLK